MPGFAQQLIPMSGPGYEMAIASIKDGFFLPNRDTSFTGTYKRAGALVFRTLNGDRTLYAYDGIKWINVTAPIAKGLDSMKVKNDTLFAYLSNGTKVYATFPLFPITSPDGSVNVVGDAKAWGDTLKLTVNNSGNTQDGLTRDSAVYAIKADTGISIEGGDNTQFFNDVKVKVKYYLPYFNAASLLGYPLFISAPKDSQVLVYDGGVFQNKNIMDALNIGEAGDQLYDIKGSQGIIVGSGTNTVLNNDVPVKIDTNWLKAFLPGHVPSDSNLSKYDLKLPSLADRVFDINGGTLKFSDSTAPDGFEPRLSLSNGFNWLSTISSDGHFGASISQVSDGVNNNNMELSVSDPGASSTFRIDRGAFTLSGAPVTLGAYKNNVTQDSVLTTDVNGVVRLKYFNGVNLSSNDLSQPVSVDRKYNINGGTITWKQGSDSILFAANGNIVTSKAIYTAGLINKDGNNLISYGPSQLMGGFVLGVNDNPTGDYTVVAKDIVIITHQTSAAIITLPSTGTIGRVLIIRNAGTGDLTLTNIYSGDDTTITTGSTGRYIYGSDGFWYKIN